MGVKVTTRVFEAPVRKAIGKLQAITRKVKSHRIEIGVFDDGDAAIDYKGNPTGIALAVLVRIHEYGLGVPERSWLRPFIDRNEVRMRLEMSLAASAELRGSASAMRDLGIVWQRRLRDWLASGVGLEPLRKSTLEARERAGIYGSAPLIATRQIIENIRVRIDGEYVD